MNDSEQAPRKVTPKKQTVFLDALRQGYSVTHAATLIGLRRESMYRARRRDPAFAAAWDDAAESGADRLEDEALRRAVEGHRTEKTVTSAGRVLRDEYGNVLKDVTVDYSDTLLIFLLKGRRPDKYAERHRHNHTIKAEAERLAAELGIDVAEVLAEAERIVAGAP